MGTDRSSSDTQKINQVDAQLPQTQCEKCGYQGCKLYAEAMIHEQVAINRCPPGGTSGIHTLAKLLDREEIELDPTCGREVPRVQVRIVEADCIGCTKCIQACPVDAIVGAPKRMHSVVAELCTGCELCIEPCPVDCIETLPAATPRMLAEESSQARTRYRARLARLQRIDLQTRSQRDQALSKQSQEGGTRAAVLAAIARGRARREQEKR